MRHRPDIDGLRALAVVPVILYHANLGCPGGFVGVDVFFVISGFLITSLIMAELGEGRFSLAGFWERRIRRIFPAAFVVTVATLAVGSLLLFPGDFEFLGKAALAQTLLLSNVFFWRHNNYFTVDASTRPLIHMWSLSVEEQFYLFFPPFLILLARLKTIHLSRVLMCLCLLSLALCVAGSYFFETANFYLLPTRAWELMVGAWLAAVRDKTFDRRWQAEAAALVGASLILYAIFQYSNETRFPGLAAIVPCMGAALIIHSGGAGTTAVGRALGLRPVVFIGLISYSIYLWHWPLLVYARYGSPGDLPWKQRVALLGASAVLASLSWKWIEKPFRKRLLVPRRRQVFALAAASVVALLATASFIVLGHGLPSRIPEKAVRFAGFGTHYAFRNDITIQDAAAGNFAELGGQDSGKPVDLLLWGDSHAMAVASALDELCRRYSVRGVEATHSSTAPILGYASHTDIYSLGENSGPFAASVFTFVARHHVKTVILAAFWSSYGPAEVVDKKLADTIRSLQALGAAVFVVKDVPRTNFFVPAVAAQALLSHRDLSRLGPSQEKYAALNQGYEPIFKHLSQLGAVILDPAPYFLNSNGSYDIVRDDQVLYFDSHHLSVEGARLLMPMFEPLFRAR